MLLLTSTSDIIRVVTGSAVSTITVSASYVDNASGTITPGRTITNITTALPDPAGAITTGTANLYAAVS